MCLRQPPWPFLPHHGETDYGLAFAADPMNQEKVAQIIRFALAKARREDHGSGSLGVIHLLKLLYLADLAHSQAHGGESFTGISWIFYHYGPWDKGAWETTTAVLEDPEIESVAYTGQNFEKRTYRFIDESLAHRLFEDLDTSLPKEVTRAVGNAVHEFGSDTNRLLHYVYLTDPMRAANPGGPIYFPAGPPPFPGKPLEQPPSLSATKRKKIEEAKAQLRATIAARAAEKQAKRVVPPPVLNERECAALEELTRLLGEDEDGVPADFHGDLTFSQDFWTSEFRREHGLS